MQNDYFETFKNIVDDVSVKQYTERGGEIKESEINEHILEKDKIFIMPNNQDKDEELRTFINQVGVFVERSYQIFLNHLGYIQRYIDSPYCLKKIIKNYDDYLTKEKYLKDLIDAVKQNKVKHPIVVIDVEGVGKIVSGGRTRAAATKVIDKDAKVKVLKFSKEEIKNLKNL